MQATSSVSPGYHTSALKFHLSSLAVPAVTDIFNKLIQNYIFGSDPIHFVFICYTCSNKSWWILGALASPNQRGSLTLEVSPINAALLFKLSVPIIGQASQIRTEEYRFRGDRFTAKLMLEK